MSKKNIPITIEVKYERLDQYDWPEVSKKIQREKRKYIHYVGDLLLVFSYLEHSLDVALADLINNRAHDEGYVVIKDLEFFEKIELFFNLAFMMINISSKRKKQNLKKLLEVRSSLKELGELRNKVAHGKWATLDEYGFIRVDAKTDKIDGFIKFRKFKITPRIMGKGTTQMSNLAQEIEDFTEKIQRDL